MLRLPPRPTKADPDVRAAFVAAGARSGAEHDPIFGAVQLRFLPDTAGGAETPREVFEAAHWYNDCCSNCRWHAAGHTWMKHGRQTGTPCTVAMGFGANSIRACHMRLLVLNKVCVPRLCVRSSVEHSVPA